MRDGRWRVLQWPFMAEAPYNLAIETSSRIGSVSIGHGAAVLESAQLGEPTRHNTDLMPTIDRLCAAHHVTPRQLGEVYVSIGPGSFTGLRIAVTAVKMFARTLGTRIVAVPSLDIVVENAPAAAAHVAVCLNAKRGQCFTGVYERLDAQWQLRIGPSLLTPAELCAATDRPLAVIGDHLPAFDWPTGVSILDESLATPHSDVVWRLGRVRAAQQTFVDPIQLTPLYVRLPEAEEKWRDAHDDSTEVQPDASTPTRS